MDDITLLLLVHSEQATLD